MGKIDFNGMALVAMEREKRKAALAKLIATPFDETDDEHIKALTHYIDHFESSTHKMRLAQASNECLPYSFLGFFSNWAASTILPIPQFVSGFFTTFIYMSAAGHLLQKFRMTDYFEELNQMKTLYNWCFKAGKAEYNPAQDNTDKLTHPELQRFISILAPLCTVEFMLAWKPVVVNADEEPTNNWVSVATRGTAAVASMFSLFSSHKSRDLTPVNDLKAAVEKRQYDVGSAIGAQRAAAYFAGPLLERAKVLIDLLHTQWDNASNTIPPMVAQAAIGPK